MLTGRVGDKEFRSEGGRGEWIYAVSQTAGITAQNQIVLEVPKTLASDYKQRGWNGQVTAIGIRIRGTHTPDVGATEVRATKLQLLAHYGVVLNNNFKNPYFQQREDLARLCYVGQIANPRAEALDQEFVDDGEQPLRGVFPQSVISPDVGIVGNDAKPFLARSPNNYPSIDRRDSYWRQLEGQFAIATPAPAAGTFDVFESIPLCCDTGNLVADSVPLDTVCDLNKPWNINFMVLREPSASFCKVAGTMATTRVDLYLYVIPLRDTDPRVHGLPWILRRQVRSQSPLQYNAGEVVLFTGNFPTTSTTTLVDTVNGNAYNYMVGYGNFNPDMTSGNTIDWNVTGSIARFPYWYLNRNPRHVYDSVWNARPNHPQIRYGAADEITVRAGRALAGLPFANVVDAANFTQLLGPVSPNPVRVLACSALELKGFPGFGALDAQCGLPFIALSGTFDFSGSISSINGTNTMLDIIVNNSPEDKAYIEDLGRGCCKDGTVTFAPTAANADSPKANIVAGKVTTMEQIKPSDPVDMSKVVITDSAKLTTLPAGTNLTAALNTISGTPEIVKQKS